MLKDNFCQLNHFLKYNKYFGFRKTLVDFFNYSEKIENEFENLLELLRNLCDSVKVGNLTRKVNLILTLN